MLTKVVLEHCAVAGHLESSVRLHDTLLSYLFIKERININAYKMLHDKKHAVELMPNHSPQKNDQENNDGELTAVAIFAINAARTIGNRSP